MPTSSQKRVTMAQIAEELGVSRFTVSSVINGRAEERRISRATVERIRAHLDERGYVPSRLAVDLRASPPNTVGILHTGRLYSHLTEAFNRIVDMFNDSPRRMEIMVVASRELGAGIRELLARGVSRLVLLRNSPTWPEPPGPALCGYLARVDAVIYNYHFGFNGPTDELLAAGCHLVGVDRAEGLRRLARLIARLGHRRAILPGGPPGGLLHGLLARALTAEGLAVVAPEEPPAEDAAPREQGLAFARATVAAMQRDGVTVACCNDDEIAAHALAELGRCGVAVPRDLSLTGFDGIPIADALMPTLTTLRVPVEDMVRRVRCILDGDRDERRHVFPLELVRGGTLAGRPRPKLATSPRPRNTRPAQPPPRPAPTTRQPEDAAPATPQPPPPAHGAPRPSRAAPPTARPHAAAPAAPRPHGAASATSQSPGMVPGTAPPPAAARGTPRTSSNTPPAPRPTGAAAAKPQPTGAAPDTTQPPQQKEDDAPCS